MRSIITIVTLAVLSLSPETRALSQPTEDLDGRVDALLSKMTLDEKVGQMTQLTLDVLSSRAKTDTTAFAFDRAKLRDAVLNRHVGSILNVYSTAFTLAEWSDVITTIQEMAVEETRLGIPVLYGVDAVHGHNYLAGGTLFPQNIGMAATWNTELVRRENEITALEMRASGIPWNFSPVLDIGRQPLWSRFFETFGEDVYLVSEMGQAAVEGMQGGDVGTFNHVAACGKHFLGYSLPLSGKDRTPAWIPDRMFREYILPPFERAIDAGIKTVMINSGEINGEPVHASRRILTELLRDELGFEGVAVTDWEDINKLHTVHRVARTQREAVKMAVDAGVDMSMVPYDYSFTDHLLALVKDGEISEARIDQSVRRILRLKMELGLFVNPFPQKKLADKIQSAESMEVARMAAEESITMVRNEDAILPLAATARVLLTGPGAASLPALHGSWTYTWQGTDEAVYPETPTIAEALVSARGMHVTSYVPGTTWLEEVNVAAAVEEAFRSDVVVIALGEPPSTEKPGDIDELDLPEIQIRLVEAIAATGKPIVIILTENRPRIVREVVPFVDAVLLAYEPGPYGADAIAGILTGTINPSGRLPFTYPRYSGSIVPYDHKTAERGDPNGGQEGFDPQWEFGEGLSYSTYRYDNLVLSSDTLGPDDVLEVRVDITNESSRSGKEVVQVYVRDEYATITPSVRRLKAFDKMQIDAASAVQARFQIPVADLGFFGLDLNYAVEAGRFTVMIDDLSAEFVVR